MVEPLLEAPTAQYLQILFTCLLTHCMTEAQVEELTDSRGVWLYSFFYITPSTTMYGCSCKLSCTFNNDGILTDITIHFDASEYDMIYDKLVQRYHKPDSTTERPSLLTYPIYTWNVGDYMVSLTNMDTDSNTEAGTVMVSYSLQDS